MKRKKKKKTVAIFRIKYNFQIFICGIHVRIRFRVQYSQYFPSFSYFTDLFYEPLGE